MIVTDPVADMLTRIRNALTARHSEVLIPASKTKNEIAQILLGEGYVTATELVDNGNFKSIKIVLKYGPNNEKVIQGLKRISKPGLRVYANVQDLPKVLNGLGIAIISTNKGIMTDKQARSQNVGGEVLAFVW
ncbi:MAG: 30S ribosomal protein S8 [Christensenellaceae bacterium]|jgi:small subunit ribosomal protein S8|nr:30S ribosomal protein S8 [Christensenellaceae bacterium]